jgi:hypothetical protein
MLHKCYISRFTYTGKVPSIDYFRHKKCLLVTDCFFHSLSQASAESSVLDNPSGSRLNQLKAPATLLLGLFEGSVDRLGTDRFFFVM